MNHPILSRKSGQMLFFVCLAIFLAGCSGQSVSSTLMQPCGPGVHYSAPEWSPDGSRIAFYADEKLKRTLYIIDLSGSAQLVQEIIGANDVGVLAWSPDGKKLATTVDSWLAVVNTDGTGVISLIDNRPELDLNPAWSPDGRQIAFEVQHEDKRTSIDVINADGAQRIEVADSARSSAPLWSPDGSRLLFVLLDSQGRQMLAAVNRDGSGLVMLLDAADIYGSPAWSPDGKRIAYAFLEDGKHSNIYAVDADGKNVTVITHYTKGTAAAPQWSPDGTRIAFVGSGITVPAGLYIMNLDGTDIHVVNTHKGVFYSWSPDGKQIAYTPSGVSEITVINADGSNVRQLTQNPGLQKCIRWPF